MLNRSAPLQEDSGHPAAWEKPSRSSRSGQAPEGSRDHTGDTSPAAGNSHIDCNVSRGSTWKLLVQEGSAAAHHAQ